MKKNMYTGNREIFIKIKNYLLNEGFDVVDSIHIGEDKYEFEESFSSEKLGIRNIHKILAWLEGEDVKYKTKVIGFVAWD